MDPAPQADQQQALLPHFSKEERCMKVAFERVGGLLGGSCRRRSLGAHSNVPHPEWPGLLAAVLRLLLQVSTCKLAQQATAAPPCHRPARRWPQALQWLRHGCLPVIVVEGAPPEEKRAEQQVLALFTPFCWAWQGHRGGHS